MSKTIITPNTKTGETFKVAGMEFIRFPEVDGKVPVVMKDIAFYSQFGDNNDLRTSTALKRMEKEILPKLIAAIGEENVCTFRTDLTTLCGLKTYGVMESKISLYTLDFYRANVEIFDKYPVDAYCWTATPDSAKPHDDPYWVVCVSPSGCIDDVIYYGDCAVRPFLIFNSSIFGSSED